MLHPELYFVFVFEILKIINLEIILFRIALIFVLMVSQGLEFGVSQSFWAFVGQTP